MTSILGGVGTAAAQVSEETLKSLSTPDSVETRIGTLEFKDGVPSAQSARTVYDTLDFTRALNVYNNSFRGASAYALRKGFHSIGADDNDIIIFSELMDSDSLFLTANADTIYYVGTSEMAGKLTGSAQITAEQVQQLMDGLWYVNIHTALNPAGEIRGQLVKQ